MLIDGTGAYPWKLCKERGRKEEREREKKEWKVEIRSIAGGPGLPKFQQRIPLVLHLSDRLSSWNKYWPLSSLFTTAVIAVDYEWNDRASCYPWCSLKHIPVWTSITNKNPRYTILTCFQYSMAQDLWLLLMSFCICMSEYSRNPFINIYNRNLYIGIIGVRWFF